MTASVKIDECVLLLSGVSYASVEVSCYSAYVSKTRITRDNMTFECGEQSQEVTCTTAKLLRRFRCFNSVTFAEASNVSEKHFHARLMMISKGTVANVCCIILQILNTAFDYIYVCTYFCAYTYNYAYIIISRKLPTLIDLQCLCCRCRSLRTPHAHHHRQILYLYLLHQYSISHV